jgi:TolB-like protein/DNA-binding winged helix-turn-helix (wHTH) protein/Flp pilus assembly protein TadD
MDDNTSSNDLRAGFTLAQWTVLPNQNRIECGTNSIHLEPKVMEVLCVLARHQGEVVSRPQLLDMVWPGTVVGDEVLSRCISVLRKHLGDDPRNPLFIATVPKAGYRLIEMVAPLAAAIPHPDKHDTPAEPPMQLSGRRWPPYAVIVALALLLAVTTWLFTESAPPPPPLDPRSPTLFADLSDWFELIIRGDIAPEAVTDIAVLPFDDLSEKEGNAFLSDGLTDELISSLGQLEGLKVVARSSSLNFRNRHEDVRAIGDILHVQAVVEGTVKRSGDQIRINVRLSSTRDGYVLWSQVFDRDLQDLLALQEEIASEIVHSLREELGLSGLQEPVSTPAVASIDAYQLYLNGRFMWKLRGESPLRRSIDLFEEALRLDPGFTRARLALANSLILLPYYSTQDEEEAFARAQDILQGVVAETPFVAGELEAIRGFIAFRRWQWQQSEEHFHKALLLNPNNPNLYMWYSQLLSAVGRNTDALKTAQQAWDLDAVSPVINHRLAIAWLWNNDNVRAAEQFARGATLGFVNLRSPAYLIFLLRMQRFEEARQIIEALYQGSGTDPQWMMDHIAGVSGGEPGDDLVDAAEAAVQRGDVLPRLQLGLWLYLNQPERTYETVVTMSAQKKFVDMELLFTAEASAFRDSGEFSDLVEEIGLEAFWENWRGPDLE